MPYVKLDQSSLFLDIQYYIVYIVYIVYIFETEFGH